jgi:hypothetical protein
MKRAVIYQRKSKFFVHASSRTTDGAWILAEPCLSADEAIDDERLATIVLTALAGSLSDVPHPTEWTKLLLPLLKQAKVKSWSAFAESATCAEIEKDDGRTTVVPTRNLGVAGGFEPDPSRSLIVGSTATAELGASVRRVLAG